MVLMMNPILARVKPSAHFDDRPWSGKAALADSRAGIRTRNWQGRPGWPSKTCCFDAISGGDRGWPCRLEWRSFKSDTARHRFRSVRLSGPIGFTLTVRKGPVMATGTVSKFMDNKGFGFITPDDG